MRYYTPPKRKTPFRDYSVPQVTAWLAKRPEDYRRAIVGNARVWVNYRRGEPVPAFETGRMPTEIEIVKYLHTMTTPPCSCGHDGNPFDWHTMDARKCFQREPEVLERKPEVLERKPEVLEDDDDDDLPF